ncbi:MAG TPA: hypothetical protein VLI05_03420 [Candidatus Saccharimonadia bacterium]|nr:hypothetical protein [Candidatus Saccharimonadia bacterium]
MKALPPLGSIRQNLQKKLNDVRQSRFFHDRLSLFLLAGALLAGCLNLVMLALHLPAVHTDVPVRYSSLGGFDGLGPWYSPFLIALFGLSITLVNGVLAYQAFTRSRIASFFLLIGSDVIVLFCLIISNAFVSNAFGPGVQ